ncbi:hypothetical protein [Citrobacter youngae]|nr:hypothetical protein [Citrobacter youngae]
MHDYSDGFALCGVNPLATAIAIPKKNRMMKRDTDHDGDLNLTGNITQEEGKTTLEECDVLNVLQYSQVKTGGKSGVSGSFRSDDGKIITVTNGIVTEIS